MKFLIVAFLFSVFSLNGAELGSKRSERPKSSKKERGSVPSAGFNSNKVKFYASAAGLFFNFKSRASNGDLSLYGAGQELRLFSRYENTEWSYKIGLGLKRLDIPKTFTQVNPKEVIFMDYYLGAEYNPFTGRYVELNIGLKENLTVYFNDYRGLLIDRPLSPYAKIRVREVFNKKLSIGFNGIYYFKSSGAKTTLSNGHGYGVEVSHLLYRNERTKLEATPFFKFNKTFTETLPNYLNRSLSDERATKTSDAIDEMFFGLSLGF